MKLTLRAKGLLAFVALAAYAGTVGYILSQERSKLLLYAMELEQIYAQESALAKTSYAVSHTTLKLHDKLYSSNLTSAFEEQVALDVELVQAGLQGLLEFFPQFKEAIDRLDQDVARLRAQPSRSNLVGVIERGRELNQSLDELTRHVNERRSLVFERFRSAYDTMSLIAASMGLLGAVFFGAVMSLFLTRLAWDIRKLALRAMEIVSGYRGPPLKVTRRDEVGDLMEAVNRTQSELRHRDQQLELAREQHFHKEKMAAIGSLAAAVAHEINNPIAAITGIAQSLKNGRRNAPVSDTETDPYDMILDQSKRITTISRQIAELTASHPPERELLDINALVRNTCSFISYDRRFRDIEMVLELDLQIPAIETFADHLTQVLMNLLINSADALEGQSEKKPSICVATRSAAGEVAISVRDNGKGMDSEVLARAFEESYTTKPPDKGRGLGLFLCKTLLEDDSNRIELESTPGVGTTATIYLKLTPLNGA